jgi:predicted O-methyltransferase YrrM
LFLSWRIRKSLFHLAPLFIKKIYFGNQKYPTPSTWFDKARPEFEKFLLPLKSDDLKILQIGAFRGDASKWMLDEVLKSPNSILYDVDTWEGSAEHPKLNEKFSEIEMSYDRNISIFKNVVKNKMTSDAFFASNKIKFDFIYVDGDHHREQVATDAENALEVCLAGGIIAFDDYGWDVLEGADNRPKDAIDNFLRKHANSIEILHKQYQVWVRVKSS